MKLFVKLALLLNLALTLTNCGNESKLLGTWGTIEEGSLGLFSGTAKSTLKFDEEFMTMKTVCHYISGEVIGPVEVSAKIKITDDKIKILETKANILRKDNFACSVTIGAGNVPYNIKNDELTIILGKSHTLNKM